MEPGTWHNTDNPIIFVEQTEILTWTGGLWRRPKLQLVLFLFLLLVHGIIILSHVEGEFMMQYFQSDGDGEAFRLIVLPSGKRYNYDIVLLRMKE